MAVGIYFVGVVIYFSNFNFGSGGDRRGAVLVFVAIFLGLLAVVSDLWAILAAGMTWKNSGSAGWLALALVLPLLEILATALVVRNL